MAQAKQFSLVLLYENVASSLPVAQALREKEIDILVVQSAAELIQTIAGRKVDMVGLSVNHTSCTSLIKVLRDKTQVQLMIFGEDKNPATSKKIDKADVDIKISGVANGYNIFMKIGHLVKRKEKESENARAILLTGGGEKTVTNKKKKAGAFIVKSKKANEEKKSKAEGYDDSSEAYEEVQKQENFVVSQKENLNNKVHIQGEESESKVTTKEKTEVKKASSPLVFKKKDDAKGAGKVNKKIKEEKEEGVGAVKQTDQPRPLGVGGTIVFSDEAKAGNKKFESDKAREGLREESGLRANDSNDEQGDGDVGKVKTVDTAPKPRSSNVIDFEEKKKKALNKIEKEKPSSKNKEFSRPVKSQEVAEDIKATPMEKLKHKKQFKDAVQKAGVATFTKTSAAINFGKTSKVCIVPVLNPKEKGFLLLCGSDNQFLSPTALQNFTAKLQEEMTKQDSDQLMLGETFNLDTFEVDIASWSDGNSQFSYSFDESESGKQVFVCFVRRESIYPEFKKMEEPSGVYRVHIQTMPPLLPVTFDVQLYFIKNKRLITYLKKGGYFTQKQIQRLYRRGFKFLYISEADKKEFLSFYVSLSINQDFQSTERKLA